MITTPPTCFFDTENFNPFVDRDALRRQSTANDRRRLRIVLGQHRADVEHRHLRAKPPVRLRHLATDRPGADHQQVAGEDPVLEDRLVGEIGPAVEPGNRRYGGATARGDDEAARAHNLAGGLDRSIVDEAGVAFDHRAAQSVKSLHRIMRRDRPDDAMNVGVDGFEIYPRLRRQSARRCGSLSPPWPPPAAISRARNRC